MEFVSDFEIFNTLSKEKVFNALKPYIHCLSLDINSLVEYENLDIDEQIKFFRSFPANFVASLFLEVKNENSKFKQKTLDYWLVTNKSRQKESNEVCPGKMEKNIKCLETEKNCKVSPQIKGNSMSKKFTNSETNQNESFRDKRAVRQCRKKCVTESSKLPKLHNQMEILKIPSQVQDLSIELEGRHDLLNNVYDQSDQQKLLSSSRILLSKTNDPINVEEKNNKSVPKLTRTRSKKQDINGESEKEMLLVDAQRKNVSKVSEFETLTENTKTAELKSKSFRKTRGRIKEGRALKDTVIKEFVNNNESFQATLSVDESSEITEIVRVSRSLSISPHRFSMGLAKIKKEIVANEEKLESSIAETSDNIAEVHEAKKNVCASKNLKNNSKGLKKNSLVCEENELQRTKCMNEVKRRKFNLLNDETDKGTFTSVSPKVKLKEIADIDETMVPAKKYHKNKNRSIICKVKKTNPKSEKQKGKVSTTMTDIPEINLSDVEESEFLIESQCEHQKVIHDDNIKLEKNYSIVVPPKVQNRGRKKNISSDKIEKKNIKSKDQKTMHLSQANFSGIGPSDVRSTESEHQSDINDNLGPTIKKQNRGRQKKIVPKTSEKRQENATLCLDDLSVDLSDVDKSEPLILTQSDQDIINIGVTENKNYKIAPGKKLEKRGRKKKISCEKADLKISEKEQENITSSVGDFSELSLSAADKSESLILTQSECQEIVNIDVTENKSDKKAPAKKLEKRGRKKKISCEKADLKISGKEQENITSSAGDLSELSLSAADKSESLILTQSECQEIVNIDVTKNKSDKKVPAMKLQKRGKRKYVCEKIDLKTSKKKKQENIISSVGNFSEVRLSDSKPLFLTQSKQQEIINIEMTEVNDKKTQAVKLQNRGRNKNILSKKLQKASLISEEQRNIISPVDDFSEASLNNVRKCDFIIDTQTASEKEIDNPTIKLQKKGKKTIFSQKINKSLENTEQKKVTSPTVGFSGKLNIKEKSELLIEAQIHSEDQEETDNTDMNGKLNETLGVVKKFGKKSQPRISCEKIEKEKLENDEHVKQTLPIDEFPTLSFTAVEKDEILNETHKEYCENIDVSTKKCHSLKPALKLQKRGRRGKKQNISQEKVEEKSSKSGDLEGVTFSAGDFSEINLSDIENTFDSLTSPASESTKGSKETLDNIQFEKIANHSQNGNIHSPCDKSEDKAPQFLSPKLFPLSGIGSPEKRNIKCGVEKPSKSFSPKQHSCGNEQIKKLPSTISDEEYADYIKLRDKLAVIRLDIDDLFKGKEFQGVMNNLDKIKEDGGIFIGRHENSAGETVPVIHTLKSKSELLAVLQNPIPKQII